MHVEDTIAAVASPAGGALRGIVRLSGAGVLDCLRVCFRSCLPSAEWDGRRPRPPVVPASASQPAMMPAERDAQGPRPDGPSSADLDPWFDRPAAGPPSVVDGRLWAGSLALPCRLYFWPGPRSFTRQTVAEIHTLGSPPLLEAALRTLCAAGARLAEPGEFTLRAFLAGRIDLTQAEAVLGVIDARDEQQLQSALAQLAGGMARPLQALRDDLLDLLADLEAGLDFVDEDIQFVSPDELHSRLSDAGRQVAQLQSQLRVRSHAAEGLRIALVGWPNVGKSSLMNALAGEPAAIVSEVAGTTRDYLTRRIAIHGLECLLIDTAGFDPQAREHVAAAAQHQAAEQARQAHLQLWCIDATRHLNDRERAALQQPPEAERLLVLTKADQLISTDMHLPAIATSSRTGQGLDELRQAIWQRLGEQFPEGAAVVAGTALRCGESLRRAAESLQQAREHAVAGSGDELVAAELRAALEELAQVAGAVYTDDLLDRIFSRFCIGK